MAVRDARRNSDGSGSRSPLGLASLPPETRDERAASSRDILGSAESSRSTSSASWVNASSKLSSDAGGEGGSEDAALPRRGPRPAAARLRPDDAGTRPDASREEDERAARGAPSGRDVLTIGARQRSAPFPRLASAPRGRASDASGILHRAAPVCTPARRDALPRAVRHFQTHLTGRRVDVRRRSSIRHQNRGFAIRPSRRDHQSFLSARLTSPLLPSATATATAHPTAAASPSPPHSYRPPFLQPPP